MKVKLFGLKIMLLKTRVLNSIGDKVYEDQIAAANAFKYSTRRQRDMPVMLTCHNDSFYAVIVKDQVNCFYLIVDSPDYSAMHYFISFTSAKIQMCGCIGAYCSKPEEVELIDD